MNFEQVQENSDPSVLLAAFESLQAGGDPFASPETPANAPTEDKSPVPEDQAAEPKEETEIPDTKPVPDAEPEGVATKDGKNIIPYSVLRSTRDRAERAEEMLKEAQARLAAMEERNNGSQGAKSGEHARTDPEPQSSIESLSEADLEGLRGDFPEVHKVLKAMMATAQKIESRIAPVENKVAAVENERQRSLAETVQEAIDAVPQLAHFQAHDPAAFALAQQFDAVLREQEAWAGKPLSERFAKVVEMVDSAAGRPAAVAAPAPAAPKPQEAPAEKRVSVAKPAVPASLSDFRSGAPAAQDEREAIENMTHQQIAAKFAGMTADQMDAYFRSL